MDQKLLHILQHSLGVDKYGNGAQYRNHYVAGGDDVALCRELVEMGCMVEGKASPLSGNSPWFNVTSKGKGVVCVESPPPSKLTRGQRRYQAYLSSESPESFGDWLKNPYWNDLRSRCGA